MEIVKKYSTWIFVAICKWWTLRIFVPLEDTLSLLLGSCFLWSPHLNPQPTPHLHHAPMASPFFRTPLAFKFAAFRHISLMCLPPQGCPIAPNLPHLPPRFRRNFPMSPCFQMSFHFQRGNSRCTAQRDPLLSTCDAQHVTPAPVHPIVMTPMQHAMDHT